VADIKGLRPALQLIRDLPDGIGAKGGGPVRRGLMKAALLWKKQVEQNAAGLGPGEKNKRTGTIRLKDSIIRQRDPDPQRDGFAERVFIGYRASAFWGAFVENGTEKQSAQPFLRPALDQVGEKPIGVFARSVELDIEKFVKERRQL